MTENSSDRIFAGIACSAQSSRICMICVIERSLSVLISISAELARRSLSMPFRASSKGALASREIESAIVMPWGL